MPGLSVGQNSRDMSQTKKRPRAEEALAAAEQRRLAPVLREAHARLGLWRTCGDKACRRRGSCGDEVDQCGARVAPQGWAWLHQVIKAMREGKSQSAAVEAANFRHAGLSRPSDHSLAELPVLGAARVFHAQRRHNHTHRHCAHAAGYRPPIHRVGRVAVAPHRDQRRHENLRRRGVRRCVA